MTLRFVICDTLKISGYLYANPFLSMWLMVIIDHKFARLILWLIYNKNTQTTSNYTIQLLQYIYQCEMCPQIAKSPELNINPKLKI